MGRVVVRVRVWVRVEEVRVGGLGWRVVVVVGRTRRRRGRRRVPRDMAEC